ncbi:MAG: LuxR C-terminal-related transcriptional regulator [Anaerolineaceae bacterium]
MSDNLLLTKLYVPPLRHNLVFRPRLVERLNEGVTLGRRLTLISAPAGFGKTTLVSEWVASPRNHPTEQILGNSVAWLSLDEGDNDPNRFLTYFITALQTIRINFGEGVLSLLQSAQTSFTASLLTELINEISTFPTNFVLVLDDYHLIDSKPIDQALTFIVEHQPPQMHLVITTREDPQLPLSRIRARDQLTEIRATDLRFTPSEAAEFLIQVTGLDLSVENITALETRTEGWIAGLQLAAISMQGHQDTPGFINSFTGSHHFVLDYLVEEVLNQQSEEVQDFLLKTSILDRLCGPLCNAVLDSPSNSGQETLEYIERANLFIAPLDNERGWYRYHHLFRDLLLNNLMNSNPGLVQELHRRASHWFADQNLPEEAIAHMLAAGDYDRAAVLVEQTAQQLDMENRLMAIAHWIDAIPDKVVGAHPWLCIYRAWGYQWMGRRDSVEPWLNAGEASLPPAPDKTDNERNHLLGHMAAIRAHAALIGENIPRVLEEGQKALSLLPERDEMRCETAVAMGGAYWALGRVIDSEKAFASARAAALLCNHLTMAVPSTCYVGMQQVKQGRLKVALQTYQDALRLAIGPDGRETPVAGFPNIKLGDLYREWNELERAEDLLVRGVQQCILLGQADVLVDGYICLARFQLTIGNLNGANETLRNADLVIAKTKVDPFVQTWLEDCWLRLWAQKGDNSAIARWMEDSELSVDSPFSFHYDLNHINLARALVTLGVNTRSEALLEQAVDLLVRLYEAADEVGWVQEKIHILILRALAEKALDREDDAIVVLLQALALAEPSGLIRTFVDEGKPMAQLLSNATTYAVSPDYINKLLNVFDAENRKRENSPDSPLVQNLIEPLSQRELEVLQLICQGLSNQEICQRLFLALDTVKGHNRRIFEKLQVHRRTEAIVRARELALF